MEEVLEYRYPFESAQDFFVNGFWQSIDGLHLSIGWIALIVFCISIFSRKTSIYIKLSTIYFAANLFSNYSYTISGVRFSELFGILAAISSVSTKKKHSIQSSPIAYTLIAFALFAFIHFVLISIGYQDIDQDTGTKLTRIILIGKVLVLGLVILSFDDEFNTVEKIKCLIDDIVFLGTLTCCLYFLQLLLFSFGISTYGTFVDAGFTGFPSFGSVSIERGHYAKFLVPLFPFFICSLIYQKNYIYFLIFLVTTIINFSASGQFFAFCYVLIFMCFYSYKFVKLKNLLTLISLTFIVAIASIVLFSRQFEGIITKIAVLGIEGNAEGGRGGDVLLQYLNRYPFGTSYGGSTLRTVGGLPEINSGINALISQFSFSSIFIIGLFLYVNYIVLRDSFKFNKNSIAKPFYIGIFVSGVIYIADILWFVPTIWLSLVMCRSLTRINRIKAISKNN